MDFVDWYYSPEGNSLYNAGPEGLNWEMKDGQPKLTDFGFKCMTDKANTDMPAEYGGGKYRDGSVQDVLSYKVLTNGEINPKTGFPYDYSLWDSYIQLNKTDIERDWQTHMGAKYEMEYFEKNKRMVVSPGSGFSAPADSADIQTLRSQIKEVIKEYSWKAMFAKNEAEFNSCIKKMQDTAKGLGFEKVLAVDKANVEAQKQARIAVTK